MYLNISKYAKKTLLIMILFYHLTLSWRRLLYGNQSIDLRCKYITASVMKELTNYGVSNLNSICFQRKKYQVVWKTRCLCYDDNLYNILWNNISNILRNIYICNIYNIYFYYIAYMINIMHIIMQCMISITITVSYILIWIFLCYNLFLIHLFEFWNQIAFSTKDY